MQTLSAALQPDVVWEHNLGGGTPEEGVYRGRDDVDRCSSASSSRGSPAPGATRGPRPRRRRLRGQGQLRAKHSTSATEIAPSTYSASRWRRTAGQSSMVTGKTLRGTRETSTWRDRSSMRSRTGTLHGCGRSSTSRPSSRPRSRPSEEDLPRSRRHRALRERRRRRVRATGTARTSATWTPAAVAWSSRYRVVRHAGRAAAHPVDERRSRLVWTHRATAKVLTTARCCPRSARTALASVPSRATSRSCAGSSTRSTAATSTPLIADADPGRRAVRVA